MEIRAWNYKIYILMMIAVCGEVEKGLVIKNVASPTHARMFVRELKKEKYLNETDDKILRLKKPRGYNILESIPELKAHYTEITNDHTFRSAKGNIKRGSIMFTMILNGIPVNGFKVSLSPQGSRPKTGDEKTWEDKYEIIGFGLKPKTRYLDTVLDMLPGETEYFPSNTVKRHNTPTQRINPSRARGHLINIERSVGVYWRTGRTGEYNRNIESTYQSYIDSIYQQAYGRGAYEEKKKRAPKGEAVIFTDREKDIIEIYRAQEEIKNGEGLTADLTDIYTDVHVIPFSTPRLLGQVMQRGNAPDPQLEKAGLSKTFDAIVEDTFTVDLRVPNFGKIRRAIKFLSGKETGLNIVCDETQKQIYEDIFKNHNFKFIKNEGGQEW